MRFANWLASLTGSSMTHRRRRQMNWRTSVACQLLERKVLLTNMDPTASGGSASMEHGSTHYDSVYGYDSDPGDFVTFAIDTSVSNGTLNFDTMTGSFDYTPTLGWTGTDYFDFYAVDSFGAVSTTERFDFTVYNTDPTASGGSTSMQHGSTHYDGVYGYDIDTYDSVTFVIDTSVSNGTLNFDMMTGSFDYTPTAAWTGSDYFEFHVVDTLGAVSTTERFDFTVYNTDPMASGGSTSMELTCPRE